MDSLPTDYQEQLALAHSRMEGFKASLSVDALAREDSLPETLLSVNASAKSKLRRIYAMSDELANDRAPFIACKKGSANCCRMNVMISSLEAEQIARASGRKAMTVAKPRQHPIGTFDGMDCPFLIDSVCSVYEDRPLVCRSHASYYATNFACDTVNMPITDAPIVEFTGLTKALAMVSAAKGYAMFADIRDFFPPRT